MQRIDPALGALLSGPTVPSAAKAEGRAPGSRGQVMLVESAAPSGRGPYHTPTGGAPGPCAGGSLVTSPAPGGRMARWGSVIQGPTMLRAPHQEGELPSGT